MLDINPDELSLDYAIGPAYNSQIAKVITASVFPNPAKDKLNLQFNDAIAADAIIEIYGNLGTKVLTDHIQKGFINKTIDVSMLRAGLYFYSITMNGEKISSGKLTILNK